MSIVGIRHRRLVTLALLSTLWSLQGFAQNTPIELPRLDGPITLDGFSDEPAWSAVPPLPMTMYLPTFQGTPTERTEIRVAYDDDYIYISGRLYDSDPSGIRINSLYRDLYNGDDAFAVYLDTFNDNENASWFMTTPGGIRGDFAVSADDQVPANGSWNTFWDVATVVTDEGWFAEMRIPFSSLRFQDKDGTVVMGLTVTRIVVRKNERVTFPSIDPKFSFRKPSVAQDVSLRGIRSHTPLYVTPYVLGGMSRISALNGSGTGYQFSQTRRDEAGFDLKYGLTENLTLDATVNTDFAQVEVDDQQVNLTRYSLFYPEKRQFFQERASLFNFAIADGNLLLHTRRIGLTDLGEPVRILGGVRMAGRSGAWDIGAMNMQTGSTPMQESENFGVLRMRRPVFNQFSYVGGMLTSRLGSNGDYNVAYGLDGVVRVFGDEYVTLKWAQSLDKQYINANRIRPFETGQGLFSWIRRSNRGLAYIFDITRTGSAFDPGIGFVPHQGSTYFKGVVQYFIYPEGSEVLRNHSWNNVTLIRFRDGDNKMESMYFAPWWEFSTKKGSSGWIEPRLQFEDVPAPFTLSSTASVPVGQYWFFDMWFNYVMPAGNIVSTSTDLIVGTFYDGWRTTASLAPVWHISPHLDLGGSYQINVIRFPDRGQSMTSHLARVRIQTAVNASVSFQTYLQYNSVANGVGLNALFRYNMGEGTDLWLVYNHNWNTDLMRRTPSLPPTSSNIVLLKYTHTFVS